MAMEARDRFTERLMEQPGPSEVSVAEREAALEAAELKREIERRMGACVSCQGCAVDLEPPRGRWAGGACCAQPPSVLFTDVELAMLRASGLDADAFEGPFDSSAGCPFRSERGCVLAAAARPNPCARYCCRALEEELSRRGILERIDELGLRLENAAARFQTARGMRRAVRDLAEVLSRPRRGRAGEA